MRRRPGTFLGVAGAVVALSVGGPPLILSLARKPLDYFTFNPWLRRLPAYVVSPDVPWREKLEKLPELALFWFSSDSPYGGIEWGFAVDVTDLARIVLMAGLFGAYFALLAERRARPGGAAGPARRRGGVAGMLTSVVGLSTGPCSVMGCGAPVIPVVGLAFAGLSSGTLGLLAGLSRVATAAVLVTLGGAVGYLGWRVGGGARPRPGPGRAAAGLLAALAILAPPEARACAEGAASLASTVRYWTERLAAPDPGARAAAAAALGETRSEAALPPLVARLADADAGVRLAVVRALERIGVTGADRVALRALLGDPSPEVRAAAARALESPAPRP